LANPDKFSIDTGKTYLIDNIIAFELLLQQSESVDSRHACKQETAATNAVGDKRGCSTALLAKIL
jgi:hypothetical protein